MGGTKCAVPSCCYRKTKKSADQRSMFKVPKDEMRAQKWAYFIPGVDVLAPNQYICDKHFEGKFLKHYQEKLTNSLRTRLTLSAVPTIFDVENQDISNFNPHPNPRYSEIQLNHPHINPRPIEVSNFNPYPNPSYSEIQFSHPRVSPRPTEISNFNPYQNPSYSQIQISHPHLSPRSAEVSNLNPYPDPSYSEIQLNHPHVSPRPSEGQLNRSEAGVLDSIPSNQSKGIETSLDDIVKDLSASEKILMQIKQEEFPPCEDGMIRVKSENTEDAFKMETEKQMRGLSPFEQLQNNFFHYASKLPESWNATQLPVGNDVIFAFSKDCPVNDGLALVVMYEKNIVLNKNGSMHYSIHGKTLVTPPNADIPNVLRDIESLPGIVTKFNELKVCQGISSREFEVDKDCTSYKDDLGFYRHVNCTLLSDMVQCDSCYSYSQYLLNYTVNNSVNNAVLSNDSVYRHTIY